MRIPWHLWPRRLAGQLVLVAIASAVLVQIIVFAGSLIFQPPPRIVRVHVDAIVRYIAGLPPGERRETRIEEMATIFPELGLDLDSDPPPGGLEVGAAVAAGRYLGPLIDDIQPWVEAIRIVPPARPGEVMRVAVGLTGGEWLVLVPRLPPPPPPKVAVPAVVVGLALVTSLLLALWAAVALVRPLRDLAAAARAFDAEKEGPPLAPKGPEEVRVAARSFDAMRRRIRDLVADRTGMLAAMGHDLRTPITRMRLRTEFVEDAALQAEFRRDLDLMGEMIEGALTYLREGRHAEEPALVDLAALIETVCDTVVDLGGDVVYEGPNHLSRRLRAQSTTRALTNLVENAVKYGTRARVRLSQRDALAVVEIEDDGPGIPAAEREAMTRPFVRGDIARNLNAGSGFGLGLAIARAVVEGQGGRLILGEAPSGGLAVTIELPSLTA